jgi:hypothetical protein
MKTVAFDCLGCQTRLFAEPGATITCEKCGAENMAIENAAGNSAAGNGASQSEKLLLQILAESRHQSEILSFFKSVLVMWCVLGIFGLLFAILKAWL